MDIFCFCRVNFVVLAPSTYHIGLPFYFSFFHTKSNVQLLNVSISTVYKGEIYSSICMFMKLVIFEINFVLIFISDGEFSTTANLESGKLYKFMISDTPQVCWTTKIFKVKVKLYQ